MAAQTIFLIEPDYDANGVDYVHFNVDSNAHGITNARFKELFRAGTDLSGFGKFTLSASASLGKMDILAALDLGSVALLSLKAASVLRPFMEPCFGFLEVIVKRRPYFVVQTLNPADALDREHCRFLMSPDDPEKILIVERFAFFKDRLTDPSLFAIPETRQYMFCTESIPTIVDEAKLRGFRFIEAEQENAVYK